MKEDYDLFAKYYSINKGGNWEGNQNILHAEIKDEDFAKGQSIDLETWKKVKDQNLKILLQKRKDRVRPGLDDKIIVSWNALTITGLCDAYTALHKESYKEKAVRAMDDLLKYVNKEGHTFHTFKEGKTGSNGFLDDYASLAKALIRLYEITFEKKYLERAEAVLQYALINFKDDHNPLYYYTDKKAEKLISRKKEIFDNVIPSSNSMLADALYHYGVLMAKNSYIETATDMAASMKEAMEKDVSYVGNWSKVAINIIEKTTEVAVVGKQYQDKITKISGQYLPNTVYCAAEQGDNALPLLANRTADGRTIIFVCFDKACKLPVEEPEKALAIIKESRP